MKTAKLQSVPDENGYFGDYGGVFVPPELETVLEDRRKNYLELRSNTSFLEELNTLYRNYVGRPSPIYPADALTEKAGGHSYT